MRRHFKLLMLLSCLAFCCAVPCMAQEPELDSVFYDESDTAAYTDVEEHSEPQRAIIYNTAKPGTAAWETATADEKYSYRDKREYKEKPEPAREIPGWYKLIVGLVNFLTSPAGKTVLWTALILIVGYVAYRIIAGQGGRLFGRRDRTPSDTETGKGAVSEEGLLDSDWEGRLHEALRAGNTRLAIRYSYMHILQVLQARGLIIYRPDKTNTGYYHELTESLRQPFRSISRQYEYTWYGDFLPEQEIMDRHMQTYNSLKKNIASA